MSPAESRSMVEMLTLLLRRRRLVFGLPILSAIAAVLVSVLLLPRLYTVEARFSPDSSVPQMSQLAGLASQFGINIGGDAADQSIDFYAELLESKELLRSAVLTDYTFSGRRGRALSGNLVELLQIDEGTADERIGVAVQVVNDWVVARADATAGIITVSVSAPWPELSVKLSERLLELVNAFNLDRRQSRAAAERRFLEARVAEAGEDLRGAEAALEQFLSDNRRYVESPQLTFEYARLQRRVDLIQEVYRSLVQGYEQARVSEVRNTPVITVLDQPRGPAEQTSPAYILNGILGLVLGGLLALGIVLGGELISSVRRSRPREMLELEREARGFLGSFALRRRGSRGAAVAAVSADEREGSSVATREPAARSAGDVRAS